MVKMRIPRMLALSVVAGFAASCLAPARAAERVYLRSGSDLICDHQKNVNGQVRLYLTASDDNYLDVDADAIVRREVVDSVAEVSAASPGAQARPAPTVAVSAMAPMSATPPMNATPLDLPRLLQNAGDAHHLDPDLLASVVRAESGGHARVVSRAGARGLMQLMPATAADLGVRDSFAAEQNVAGGASYLDALLMYYHENLAFALAAYNAGPADVNRYGGIPPYAETRRYVARVIHDYNQRKLREARQMSAASSLAAVAARR